MSSSSRGLRAAGTRRAVVGASLALALVGGAASASPAAAVSARRHVEHVSVRTLAASGETCAARVIRLWRTQHTIPDRVSTWCAATTLQSITDIELILSVVDSQLGAAPEQPPGTTNPCARLVVADWYADGRIKGRHSRACLRAALAATADDLLRFSRFPRDVVVAARFALLGRVTPKAVTAALDRAAAATAGASSGRTP